MADNKETYYALAEIHADILDSFRRHLTGGSTFKAALVIDFGRSGTSNTVKLEIDENVAIALIEATYPVVDPYALKQQLEELQRLRAKI